MAGNPASDNTHPTSLTAYLSQAYLSPLIIPISIPLRVYSKTWPRMEELHCDEHHSRRLKKITDLPMMAVENAVRTYFLGFEDRIRITWNNASFTMPCPGVITLGNSDLNRLVVRNEPAFMRACQHFIFGTAAEAIRTIEGRPFDDEELTFVRYMMQSAYRGQKICTLYIFGQPVPPTGILRPGIMMFALPPWMFGLGDFRDFTSRRTVVPGEFDREPPDMNTWSNAIKLWAVVYDSCKVSGYRWFVVTTYTHWVFGTWSLDWSAVEVSSTIPFDRTRGMTLVELLVFWTQSARNEVRYWQLTPNAD